VFLCFLRQRLWSVWGRREEEEGGGVENSRSCGGEPANTLVPTKDLRRVCTASRDGGEDAMSELGTDRSSVRSARTHTSASSKRSWRRTPSTFEDIDRYGLDRKKKKKEEEEEEIPEPTLLETLQANAAVFGVLAFLMLITLLASSVPGLGLWIAAFQTLAIGFVSLKWEDDQWVARGGCRKCCQCFFVLFPLAMGIFLIIIAGQLCRVSAAAACDSQRQLCGSCKL
jgi:hypothetical protein